MLVIVLALGLLPLLLLVRLPPCIVVGLSMVIVDTGDDGGEEPPPSQPVATAAEADEAAVTALACAAVLNIIMCWFVFSYMYV